MASFVAQSTKVLPVAACLAVLGLPAMAGVSKLTVDFGLNWE